jgi:hypothetical protein
VDTLSTPFASAQAGSAAKPAEPATIGLSPVEALAYAFEDAVRLLFRPFDAQRWIKLTLVCLFLGGGTPTAALQWTLSTLPRDIRLSDLFIQVRQYISQNFLLILLVVALGLGLGLTGIYLRSVFRFVLVDSLVNQKVSLGPAWKAVRPLGQAYFFWLLAILTALGVVVSAAALAASAHWRAAAAPSLVPSLILMATLAAVVFVGLIVAVLITLTDDLVVPLMYAGRWSLPASWRQLAAKMRGEPGPFAIYLLLRFAVSVAVGVAVLLFLFPVLMGIFSGAIIAAALVVLALPLVGLVWVWKPLTIGLAVAGLLLLSGLLFVLLSAAGMPGQVFLQDFGLRFIASRFRSLEILRRPPRRPPGWHR